MLGILLITILHYSTVESWLKESITIWDKNRQSFVEFDNISGLVSSQKGKLSAEEDLERKDMRGIVLTASYYEEQNMIMFYENDTKVTGICGEIWNLLAYHLNFTLKPVRFGEKNFGERLENGSYSGLMGFFHRNETQVILRTGYFNFRANLFDYTMPVWYTKYLLHIKPKYEYDNEWIITMFTRQTWFVILLLFLVLSVAGYVLQNESRKQYKTLKSILGYYNLNDHFFYTFSMMCGQGYLPENYHRQNKILTLSKSIFAWLTLLAFSSNLIYRMANRTIIPPFRSLDTMMNKTKYGLFVFKGSMIYELLKNRIQHSSVPNKYAILKRITFVEDPRTMYSKVCHGKKLYAMLETQDKAFSRSRNFCSLISVGESYFQTWVGFAVPKRFPYKRIIDISIAKLHEAGLVDVLKKRWLYHGRNNKEQNRFTMIDLDQVYLIFVILFIGIAVSLLILSLENIVFVYKKGHK